MYKRQALWVCGGGCAVGERGVEQIALSLTIADTTGTLSAIANVAMAFLGGLTLLLAYSQINSWRAEKMFDRTSASLERIMQGLEELRDSITRIKAAEIYTGRHSKMRKEGVEQATQELAQLRPVVNRVESDLLRLRAYFDSPKLNEVVGEAIEAWRKETNARLFSATLLGLGAQMNMDFGAAIQAYQDELEELLKGRRSEADLSLIHI